MLKISRALPEIFLPLVKFDYHEDDYEITQPINISREFKHKTLLLGIPGAFIPSVQYKLLAEYRRYADEIAAICNVDKIAVVSVNDPHVLKTFAEEIDAGEKLVYISDFNGECITALGTSISLPNVGLRCRPFRCVVNNGEITSWVCEDDWKPTSCTRVHRLLREFSGYLPYPMSVYPERQ